MNVKNARPTFQPVYLHAKEFPNFLEISNHGGRLRWKIENEGFNVQKNGGFGLEHAYSRDSRSLKIFYYLLQMAHIFTQLVEKGSLFKKIFPRGLGSSKNLAAKLKEEWIDTRVAASLWDSLPRLSLQIRFNETLTTWKNTPIM